MYQGNSHFHNFHETSKFDVNLDERSLCIQFDVYTRKNSAPTLTLSFFSRSTLALKLVSERFL